MTAKQTASKWTNGNLQFFDKELNSDYPIGVWADCPVLAMQSDPSIGYVLEEDFLDFWDVTDADPPTMNGYTAAQDTSGGIAVVTDGIGGELTLDCESTTQHQGITLVKDNPMFKCAANKDLWFEARFKVSDDPSKCQIFVGLANTDTDLMPSGDIDEANNDFLAFAIETGGGTSLKFTACKDGTQKSDTVATLTDNTYVRCGFKVLGTDTIKVYVNDVEQTLSNVTSDYIPTTDVMTPSFVCQSDGGSKDPILYIDYYKVAQLR